MSLKAVHRILDLIDHSFDLNQEIDFINDPTLEHYKIPLRKVYLILENLLEAKMIEGIILKGSYDDFQVIQESPRLTFKGMDWLYSTIV